MSKKLLDRYIESGFFPAGIQRSERVKIWSADDLTVMAWAIMNQHRVSAKAPDGEVRVKRKQKVRNDQK